MTSPSSSSPSAPATTPFTPLEGGCACGRVRYRLTARPLEVHCCHCTSCQRMTGSAFSIIAAIERRSLDLLLPAAPFVAGSRLDPVARPSGPPPSGPPPAAVPVEPRQCMIPTESHRGFTSSRCPTCLVGLWLAMAGGRNDRVRFLHVGTLDRPWELPVDAHMYTRSKRDFVVLQSAEDGGAPQFEGFFPFEALDDLPPQLATRVKALIGAVTGASGEDETDVQDATA